MNYFRNNDNGDHCHGNVCILGFRRRLLAFPVVLNASSTVRHVNDVYYSVCAHTIFLKHNVCSFASL